MMEAWIFQVVMSLNFCWSGEISDHCPDVLNATLRDTSEMLGHQHGDMASTYGTSMHVFLWLEGFVRERDVG